MDFGKHAQRVKPTSQRSGQWSVFCPEPPLGPRCPACQEQAQTKSMLSLCHPAAAVKRMDKCQPFPSIYCQTHNQILTLCSNAQLTLVLRVKSARQSVVAPFFGEYTTKWEAEHLRTSSVSHCCLMWLQSTLQSHQILRNFACTPALDFSHTVSFRSTSSSSGSKRRNQKSEIINASS